MLQVKLMYLTIISIEYQFYIKFRIKNKLIWIWLFESEIWQTVLEPLQVIELLQFNRQTTVH